MKISEIKTKSIQNIYESILNERDPNHGKSYDWTKDFEFKGDVVRDLMNRKLFAIDGQNLRVMIPVNRPEAKNYYKDSYKKPTDKEYGSDDDLEKYNILHIDVALDHKNRQINVDRYFGHRFDWTYENHTGTHRDYSEVPPISEKTVKSLLDLYKDSGVCEMIVQAIEEKFQNYLEYQIRDQERSINNVGGPWSRYHGEEAVKMREKMKHELEKFKSDHSSVANPQLNTPEERKKNGWIDLYYLTQQVMDGMYESYSIHFDEPEDPTPEYNKEKNDRHEEIKRNIDKDLRDYYSKPGYKGD